MDHMEIGSGILQMLISKIIKKALSNRIRKQVGLKLTFNDPIRFDIDTQNVTLSVSCTAKLPVEDFKEIIGSFM